MQHLFIIKAKQMVISHILGGAWKKLNIKPDH
jgi:hypothetical protein